MRRILRAGRLPLLLTLALALVLVAAPGREEPAVYLYVLALAGVGLARVLATLRRVLPPRRPSAFEAALQRRPRRVHQIPELERIEREVALGLATAFDLHYRLRPRLRRIAAELLAARRGIELDADPVAARRALGEDAWELVRDREPPEERFAAGVDIATLRSAVTALEAL